MDQSLAIISPDEDEVWTDEHWDVVGCIWYLRITRTDSVVDHPSGAKNSNSQVRKAARLFKRLPDIRSITLMHKGRKVKVLHTR
jgi:hypothetical protein